MSTAARSAIGIVVAAFALLLFHAFCPHYSTVILWEFRASMFWLLPLLGLAVLAMVLVIAVAAADEFSGNAGLAVGVGALSVGVFLAALVAAVWWVVSTHSYLQDRVYYEASAVTEHGSAPAFGQRAPFQVAEAQARPNLGDVSGTVNETSFLPETGRYATLVDRNGFNAGYQVVLDQEVPLAGGRGAGTTCQFAKSAAVHDGGAFSKNLGRRLNEQRRGLMYDSGDIYAYCDGSTPVVVVPLKKQSGLMVVTERPAGVALYNGRTGKLTIRASAAGIPGPAYPLSLAAKQRDALTASGGYWDYRGGRSGFEASEDDVNSGNTTEFVLPLPGSKNAGAYATMLTGRGSATAISAVSIVDASARSGGLAKVDVYRTNPEWVSPDAIESRIKADYQDLPNWQSQQVMEVTPLDGGRWAATIGNGQNVLYRVTGAGDLKTDQDPKTAGIQATCLHRADGTTIRCGTLADTSGNGVGTEYGSTPTPAPSGTPTVPASVSALTDAQLAQLQRQVAEESARRLTAK